MPKRTDIKRVLVIGSGPIVIGQAAEFDYSGTQACRALRSEGLEVVLVNSNPATIMTDPEFSDATYVEPLTPEIVEAIIAKVYKGPSWLDGKECIVLDYSQTSILAHRIRDEIRLISPGFYLGKVYWNKDRLIDFCLQF